MPEVLVAPDVPALVLGYLADELDDIDTGTVVPTDRPNRFVTARRVGGQRRDVVLEDVTLVVEAWAATHADADDLGQLVHAHLHALEGQQVDDVQVYRVVDLGAPSDDPDALSAQPRHTLTVQVTVRCRPYVQSS